MSTTPPLAPWQRTLRTVFQALIGLAVMLPVLVSQAGLDGSKWPWLVTVLAVAAFVTRIMAIPAVEVFLATYLPWLSATAGASSKRKQGGYAHTDYLIGLALAVSIGALLMAVLVALTT